MTPDEQCHNTIRLADHDHPRTGIPVQCVLAYGHDGDHLGETTDPWIALRWTVTR